MRVLIAALLLIVASLAEAQSPPAALDPARTSSLPPIGLPLPPIGLPLPGLGLAPAGPTPTTTPGSARPPRRGGHHRRSGGAGVIYVVPAYGWDVGYGTSIPGFSTAPAVAAPAPEAPARPAAGTLRLELQPRPTGQLFVDGAYVGTLDDLGSELTLLAGTRQIEIRQAGYQPFTLTARIDEGRALVYRGELQPVPAAVAPPPASPPIPRKPLYYIPGCYLGDVPPKDAGLPPACDPSRAVTFRP